MNSADIRDMRKDELGKKLEELQKQLFTLRTQAVTEKIENSKGISNIRRDIARVKTVIREQELA